MTPKEMAVKICSNAWAWGLEEFCEKVGLDPHTEYARSKFRDFQKLAELIGSCDETILNALIS